MKHIMQVYNVGFEEQCFVPLSGDRILSIVFMERSEFQVEHFGGGPIKMNCAVMHPKDDVFRKYWDINSPDDYIEFYNELEFYKFMNINKEV